MTGWGCSKPVGKAALGVGLALLLAGLGRAGEAPARPPVVIASLGVTPRYPAYDVEYPDGLPQAIDPDTGRPLAPEEARRVQRRPRAGEAVTVTARLVNTGDGPTGPLRVMWVVNRRRQPEQPHAGLTAGHGLESGALDWPLTGGTFREVSPRSGSSAELSLTLPWKRGLTVRLEVRGDAPTGPPVAREARLDGLAILVVIPRAAYTAWRPESEAAGFESWAQGQADLLRARMAGSVYPTAPRGVDQPFHLDALHVLEDDADLPAIRAVAARNGWDGVWSLSADHRPGPVAELDPEWFAQALEWLGVADLRRLAVEPEANRARLQDTDGLQPGYQPAAVPLAEADSLPEHVVLGLNRLTGQRRGHRGSYLFDLPRRLRLRVLDGAGRPIPEAEIAVFQKEGGGVPPDPLATGRTAANGELSLPRRRTPTLQTADGFTLTDNPFGVLRVTGENGLLLVQVRARDAVEHLWLPVTALNLAHWREQGREVTVDLRTRLPGARAPAAVAALTARGARRNGVEGVELRWETPGREPAAYTLYRARYPTYQFERLDAVTFLRREYFDPTRDPRPVRYAVTAVDLAGDESALRTAVWPPPPPR